MFERKETNGRDLRRSGSRKLGRRRFVPYIGSVTAWSRLAGAPCCSERRWWGGGLTCRSAASERGMLGVCLRSSRALWSRWRPSGFADSCFFCFFVLSASRRFPVPLDIPVATGTNPGRKGFSFATGSETRSSVDWNRPEGGGVRGSASAPPPSPPWTGRLQASSSRSP